MARDDVENKRQVWGRAAASGYSVLLGRGWAGDGRWAGLGCARRAAERDAVGSTGAREGGRAVGIGATALRSGSGRHARSASRTSEARCVRIERVAVRYRSGSPAGTRLLAVTLATNRLP
jgi:hypothetical protein